MNLNKTTTHAVRLLVACSRAKTEMVKVADLAVALELTQQNTFKIVHLLSRAGFVSAMRGRNGGVALARPADQIKVGEVVAAMEYPDADQAGKSTNGEKTENVPLMGEALSAFLEVLNQNSIADLAAAADQAASKVKPSKKTAARKSLPPIEARKPRSPKRTQALTAK